MIRYTVYRFVAVDRGVRKMSHTGACTMPRSGQENPQKRRTAEGVEDETPSECRPNGDELVEMIEGATFGMIAADRPPSFALTPGWWWPCRKGLRSDESPHQTDPARRLSRVCEPGQLPAHEAHLNARRPAPFRVVLPAR